MVKHAQAMEPTLPLVNCFWCERLHPGAHALAICPECTARYSTMRTLEMSGSYPPRFAYSYARSTEESRLGSHAETVGTIMWKDLREVLVRLWQWSQKSAAERRVAKARARFWAGVREGEREAEARSRP